MTDPQPTALASLDTAHRTGQQRIAAATAALALASWREQVKASDLSGTGRSWLARVIELIISGRRRSAQLAGTYVFGVRGLQLPGAPRLEIPPIPEPNLEQIRKSLIYTGLAGAAKRLATIPERIGPVEENMDSLLDGLLDRQVIQLQNEAMQAAGKAAAAAAVRHTTNGGRDMIQEIVKKDPVAQGFVRITSGDPCYFCAMLASRGPVYSKDSFSESDPRFQGFGEHKVHDSCQCSLRPLYSRSPSEWPEASQRFDELWRTATKGKSGKQAILAFRQAYEGRTT